MHQAQSFLGAQPTQEQGSPVLLAVVVEPHLLPVALILPGNADAFAHGGVELLEQRLQLLGAERCAALQHRRDLTLHHQIAVAADRRGGLHVGVEPEAEMR